MEARTAEDVHLPWAPVYSMNDLDLTGDTCA
jgi:hypothetical protein